MIYGSILGIPVLIRVIAVFPFISVIRLRLAVLRYWLRLLLYTENVAQEQVVLIVKGLVDEGEAFFPSLDESRNKKWLQIFLRKPRCLR